MSKTTNKSQLQILLDLMEENRDIARGFQSRSKDEVLQFWTNAEKALNACGPPIKSIQEWKKVWSDQKKYVRGKAAENLKSKNATGGGPHKEHTFSEFEQGIYNLVGMKESVEGVAASTFGLGPVPKRKATKENIEPPEKVIITSVEFLEGELTDNNQIENLIVQTAPSPKKIAKKKTCSRPKPSVSSTASETFQKELELQADLCRTVKDLAEGMNQNLKVQREICDALKTVADNSQELLHIKKQKLTEIKRHNLALEELRKRELEDKNLKTEHF